MIMLLTMKNFKKRTKEVFEWILEGKLKFSIAARIALKDAVQAHKLLQGRDNSGKILLIP